MVQNFSVIFHKPVNISSDCLWHVDAWRYNKLDSIFKLKKLFINHWAQFTL